MKAFRRGAGAGSISHGRVQTNRHKLDKEYALDQRRTYSFMSTGNKQTDIETINNRIAEIDKELNMNTTTTEPEIDLGEMPGAITGMSQAMNIGGYLEGAAALATDFALEILQPPPSIN